MTELTPSGSELRGWIEEVHADLQAYRRRHPRRLSPQRRAAEERLRSSARSTLESLDVDGLSREGQADWHLMRGWLDREDFRAKDEASRDEDWACTADWANRAFALEESSMQGGGIDAEKAAEELVRIAAGLARFQPGPARHAARGALRQAKSALEAWHGFYSGYDPAFSWWCRQPWEAVQAGLASAEAALGEEDSLGGKVLGREALEQELRLEWIGHSVEELLAIGDREWAWCEAELAKAASEMGCRDGAEARERLKDLRVEPGGQPQLIQDLTLEAIGWLESRDLVTVPQTCKDTWRMSMMSAERQKVSPFFLGGEAIIVSYPTDTMSHEEKRMSMRGNNPHFSRATVQHELIPGHHLQHYAMDRWRPHRQLFNTPFWIEGWTLHWEMLLWDLGFPRGPEDRVGMLFWRMHRCARILFSLRFHLGEMTAEECVDLLVERVGHERANAEAEVRRSFAGDYPPLYQAAYMLGGKQVRSLNRRMRGQGWTERQFHDEFLRQNEMPIELLACVMDGSPLGRDWRPGRSLLDEAD